MYVLGLTTLGDAAASLTQDGDIVAAAEEERFSRQEHHIGFPYQAVQYCLDEAGVTLRIKLPHSLGQLPDAYLPIFSALTCRAKQLALSELALSRRRIQWSFPASRRGTCRRPPDRSG